MRDLNRRVMTKALKNHDSKRGTQVQKHVNGCAAFNDGNLSTKNIDLKFLIL
jgi:hypothetical protein